ncbi:unnamed protein product [Rodentolepis nana]|uniref:Secreted protein n=1 Tax=Rodentolepis nana TaxID=102285 RepID=A0A0R3T8R1_RODNA|nr:unnamed protein product [Rodentolepis nana]
MVIGLFTLCTLRLSDSHQHHSAARRARIVTTGNPVDADPPIWRMDELCNRWRHRRQMGPFAATSFSASSDEVEPIVSNTDAFDSFPIVQTQAPSSRLSESISRAMAVWPPIPSGPAPTRNEVFGTDPALITHPPPIAPMSRAERREARGRCRPPDQSSTEGRTNSPTIGRNRSEIDESPIPASPMREPHSPSSPSLKKGSKSDTNQCYCNH